MAQVTEYEVGLIRTDSGKFLDKGNKGVDPAHPDFTNRKDIQGGEVDAREAFAAADEYAQQYGLDLTPNAGTYRIDSDRTLTSGLRMARGATIKPASGVTVTINGPFEAGLYQVFDTSAGGSVVFTSVPDEVVPEWYGAVGDNTADDTVALQAAVDATGDLGGSVYLTQIYRTTAEIVFPLYSSPKTIHGPGTINCDHGGNGINLNSYNFLYGKHVIKGIILEGPDPVFPPAGYVPESTGAGIYMPHTYHCSVKDVTVKGFKYGVIIEDGIKNVFSGRTYFWGNQYGVYLAGGIANANSFTNVQVRENRKVGVYIEAVAGDTPTANTFSDCLIESNVPYAGGFSAPNPPTDAVGVYLKDVRHNRFNNCYYENHNHHIWVDGGSHNMFLDSRGQDSGTKLGIIRLTGGTYSNTFRGFTQTLTDATAVNFEITDPTTSLYNEVIDCHGFNMAEADKARLTMRNLAPRAVHTSTGQRHGALTVPPYAVRPYATEGTTAGRIEGIGTATATMHVGGYGEFLIDSSLSADTTITTLDELAPGQFLYVSNDQTSYSLTFKNGGRTSSLILHNDKDFTLEAKGDAILFYVSYLGRAIEVSRNKQLGDDIGVLTAWVTVADQNPSLGTIPAYSYVDKVELQVTEAFNSDGTDYIAVGYDATTNAFAGVTAVETTGIKSPPTGTNMGYQASSREVEAYYTTSGSAPTTGKALVSVTWRRVDAQP